MLVTIMSTPMRFLEFITTLLPQLQRTLTLMFFSVILWGITARQRRTTASLQGLVMSLMAFGTPPRRIHLSSVIRSFKLLHTSPSNTQNVYLLPIKLECLLPQCHFCVASIADIHARLVWVLPIKFLPRKPAISTW